MNKPSQNRIHHHWLGWIAMLAVAAVFSPINIHIVVGQETPEIVIAPADPGEPPTPPQAPEQQQPEQQQPEQQQPEQQQPEQQQPEQQPAIAAPVEPSRPAVEVPAAEPAPASAPAQAQSPAQTPDVPAAASEITNDTEIGKLLPQEEPATEARSANEVRTLSVEPSTRPLLPENRPSWVGAESDYSTAQHYLYVGSLPTQEPQQADEALDEPLIAAVRNYIDQEVVNQLGAASSMPVTAEFIRKNLIDNPEGYECALTTGQEPLYQKWVTVRITPEQRELFRQWHTEAVQRSRLKPLGINLVAFLVLISLTHVVLRRFSGTSPLTAVNQHVPEQVVGRKSNSSVKWIFFALLFAAVGFAFLLPLFALTLRTSTVTDPIEVHVGEMPDLHKEVRIETLDGGHRTIILENKSYR